MGRSKAIAFKKQDYKNFNLSIHPQVRKTLECIGCPEPSPFVPDEFQAKAIEAIKNCDVLVTAPTGAGKTYIAVKAIEEQLKQGKKSWYASPLKALSNSKYEEFGQLFGTENVGILTGDRKENPDAPIIVGTTEILRNQLYDVMHHGLQLKVDLVVIDEAHYLGDEDRGVVWEEVLIYLPPRVRVLLLSATIKNAREICEWLKWLRGNECTWVKATKRPVPLYPLFLFPDGELVPLETQKGFFKKIETLSSKDFPRFYFPDIPKVMNVLRKANLLPAIFFLKSRADCEKAIEMCHPVIETTLAKNQREFLKRIDELLQKYPFLKNHKHLDILRKARVGAHHGGQLPYWKVMLETLMQEGYLEAIFSTSTVAAGVNFPARTVVITQSDRYNGHEFVPLTANELLQMTGRAGRRGMDEIGFVLILPGPYQDVRYIHRLLKSPPDPIISQVKINFSMVLNLLLSHRPEEIKNLFSVSLATFQNLKTENKKKKRARGRLIKELNKWKEDIACGGPENILETRSRYRNLTMRIKELKKIWRKSTIPLSVQHLLVRGRVFYSKSAIPYVVIERPRHNSIKVRSARLTLPVKTRKRKVKVSEIKISRIARIGRYIGELPPVDEIEKWEELIKSFQKTPKDLALTYANPLGELNELLEHRGKLPCEHCKLYAPCIKETGHPFSHFIRRYESFIASTTSAQDKLWNSFMYHLKFLQQEGYVDDTSTLTEDGLWTSKLRLDQPLLISEGIRKGVFPIDDPPLLAALIAPFVMDRERGHDSELASLIYQYPDLAKHYFNMIYALQGLKNRLQEWGFYIPPLPFWTVPTLYFWAKKRPWDEIKSIGGVDEGDLVMVIIRTADHLHQMESLVDTHRELAISAKEARNLIMREPVIAI